MKICSRLTFPASKLPNALLSFPLEIRAGTYAFEEAPEGLDVAHRRFADVVPAQIHEVLGQLEVVRGVLFVGDRFLVQVSHFYVFAGVAALFEEVGLGREGVRVLWVVVLQTLFRLHRVTFLNLFLPIKALRMLVRSRKPSPNLWKIFERLKERFRLLIRNDNLGRNLLAVEVLPEAEHAVPELH